MLDTTKADFDHAVQILREEWAESGTLDVPFAMLRMTSSDEPSHIRINAYGLFLRDGELKPGPMPQDVFFKVLVGIAKERQADLVMVVSETVCIAADVHTEEEMEETKNKYLSGELSVECARSVCIYLEDQGSCEMWYANVQQDGTTLSDFQRLEIERRGPYIAILPQYQPEVVN
jgi:hypothetical protein